VATVTVECVIDPDGYPSHCNVVKSTGAASYTTATLNWLTGPKKPRSMSPCAADAVSCEHQHRWVVSFCPPKGTHGANQPN
jgi:hypothetical protein